MFGMDRTLRATSAPQAGLLSSSPTNAPQPAAIRSTGSSVASPARLQQFVKFVRELVGDRGLELIEAIEVDIKGFLRHRLADQVVDGHRLDRFRA